MKFFKFLNFPLKSTEISVGLRFQLASVTINFTDNRDYRAVLYSMRPMMCMHVARIHHFEFASCIYLSLHRGSNWYPLGASLTLPNLKFCTKSTKPYLNLKN